MQAVLSNTIKLIKNINAERRFPKEVIPYLLKAAENADNKTRNDIENQLVKMGETAIPALVNALEISAGTTRALIAMTLIRIGSSSIEPLKNSYQDKSDFHWIVDYIVNEIEGSRRPLNKVAKYSNLTEVLVG